MQQLQAPPPPVMSASSPDLRRHHQQHQQQQHQHQQQRSSPSYERRSEDYENVPPSPLEADAAYSSSDSSDGESGPSFGGVLAGRLDARVAQHGDWGEDANDQATVTNTNTTERNEPQTEDREEREERENARPLVVVSRNNTSNTSNTNTTNTTNLKKSNATKHKSNNGTTKYESINQNVHKKSKANGRSIKKSKTNRNKTKGNNNPLQRQTPKQMVEEKKVRLDARTERMRQDIGKRLSIYSSKYDEWTKGEIVSIDAERRMHCVQYDDEERRWHRMDLLKFSIVDE